MSLTTNLNPDVILDGSISLSKLEYPVYTKDDVDGMHDEINNIVNSIKGGIRFAGVIGSKDCELPGLSYDEMEDDPIITGTWISAGSSEEQSMEFKIGDLIIITNNNDSYADEPNKEYILIRDNDNQIKWVELGDVTPAQSMIDESLKNYYTKSETPIVKGNVNNSAVLDGKYNNYSNKAISQVSMAIGAASTAGLKGHYYKAIDFANKKIYLSSSQPNSIATSGFSAESIICDYGVGDYISIVAGAKFENCSKITAKNSGVITVDSLPFTTGDLPSYTLGIGKQPDDFTLYSANRSISSLTNAMSVKNYDKGTIDMGGGALAEGVQTFATNIGAHAEGIQTHAYGQYSHTEGFRTQAGYAAHAEGNQTEASGMNSHAEGNQTEASGKDSHAEGKETVASGIQSHAEGQYTQAIGAQSHTEGESSIAKGNQSHAEGYSTLSEGVNSHAEGESSQALGKDSHAEGFQTTAKGTYTHAEGYNTIAYGNYSHAEGFGALKLEDIDALSGSTYEEKWDGTDSANKFNMSVGNQSHVEGNGNIAIGKRAHVEGIFNKGKGDNSHAEGRENKALGAQSHAEGYNNTASGLNSHAEGWLTIAEGHSAHAEGGGTNASGNYSHAEGESTNASGYNSHAEGSNTIASGEHSHAEGYGTDSIGNHSHAEGYGTAASGIYSHAEGAHAAASGDGAHAEGSNTIASGDDSHAEGYDTIASGDGSHAEGYGTTASGDDSHAEGFGTTASGGFSHAEGSGTIASGDCSHAEGSGTTASAYYSHAEGIGTTAGGSASHAEGIGTKAIGDHSHAGGFNSTANSKNSFVHGEGLTTTNESEAAFGKFNKTDNTTIFSVGAGSSKDDRKNAFEIKNASNITQYSFPEDITLYVRVSDPDDEFAQAQSKLKYQYQTSTVAVYLVYYRGEYPERLTNLNGESLTYSLNEGDYVYVPLEKPSFENTYVNGEGELCISDENFRGIYMSDNNFDASTYIHSLPESWFNGSVVDGGTMFPGADISITTGTGIVAYINDKRILVDGDGQNDSASVFTNGDGTNSVVQLNTGATATGANSVATGAKTIASGNNSYATGNTTEAQGLYSFAGGLRSKAKGNGSLAFGQDCVAGSNRAVAIGFECNAKGFQSFATGRNIVVNNNDEFGCGKFNISDTNTIFSVGVGKDINNRKNAITVNLPSKSAPNNHSELILDPNGFELYSILCDGMSCSRPGIKCNNSGLQLDGNTFISGNAEINGNITYTGSCTQSSDERLKDFKEDIEVDLEKLLQLRKSYFSFKNNPDVTHLGVSAQQLQQIYPELVIENNDGYLSVDYVKLSVVALKAIDKLYDNIKSFEDRLSKIENMLLNQ